MHPTYIGQVERGEKNVTIESLEKICFALDYPMEQLFHRIVSTNSDESVANECYSMIITQDKDDQKKLLHLLQQIIEYKGK